MAGLGFCSEDRKNEGVLGELTVRENIILALQARRGMLKFLPQKKQLEIADRLIESLKIKTPSAENAALQLSGGNQQKVMLARWLATNPQFSYWTSRRVASMSGQSWRSWSSS